ncbi:membrane protein insertase YidC [Thermodesulfobacteriota bacterium]
MEKRAIIAFILSFLVFMVWTQLYAPRKDVTVDNITVDEQQEKTGEPVEKQLPSPAIEKTAEEKPAVIEGIEEKEITIETPLYIALLSNNGPSIRSFKLKKYRETLDPESPPVELFSGEEHVDSYFSFHFDTQHLLNKKNLIYDTDGESSIITSGQAHKDIIFQYITENGLLIEQIFRFFPDKYDIGLSFNLINQTGNNITGKIRTEINNLPPDRKARYYSFIGAKLLLDNELEDLKPKDLEEEEELSGNIDWLAYENEYFISAVIPEDTKDSRFRGILQPSGLITANHISPPIDLPSSTQISKEYSLFLGPRDIDILNNFGKKLDEAIDFGFFDIIAGPLHYALKFFNGFVHNFGISIIILTIIIKILFWPLTQKSQKSMKEMKKLQPLMTKIREKYKDDRERMNKEIMGLYRTYKVNPMGGCLPMVIQIPVFIALYSVLSSAIELRHAPFMLWINDLAAPGRLFSFPFSIPFMDPPYGIPVLTLLMGASMFITQKMQPMVGDPAQAKIMMFLPVMFTVMFINFPSGLVLYWLTQNILSIGQQYLINKKPD